MPVRAWKTYYRKGKSKESRDYQERRVKEPRD